MGTGRDISSCIILLLLLMIVSLTQGAKAPLECYTCSNELSYDECTYYQSSGTCKSGEDRCIKAKWDIATVGTISTGYIKGCTSQELCTTQAHQMCNNTDGYVICEVLCCEGKLCNDTNKLIASRLVMVVLVLLACLKLYY